MFKYLILKFKIKFIKSKDLEGFTLMEVLVATTLFVVVAVGGLSVLLSSQRAYQRISQNRVAIDNTNLVMDTITREIKFGSKYGCVNFSSDGSYNRDGNNFYNTFSETYLSVADTQSCNAIAFTPEGTTTLKNVYYYDSNNKNIHQVDYNKSGSNYNLIPGTDMILTGKDFQIDNFFSNIYGIDNSDYIQPRVDLYLSGLVTVTQGNNGSISTTTLFLQSTISQRIIDN